MKQIRLQKKKNNPHTPTIIFWGSFESKIFNFRCISILYLYFVPLVLKAFLFHLFLLYLLPMFFLFFPQSTGSHMSYGPWLNISWSVSARQSWLVGQSWVTYFFVANLSRLLSETSNRSYISAVNCCLMSVRIYDLEQTSPVDLEIAFRYSTGTFIHVLLMGHWQPQVFAGM